MIYSLPLKNKEIGTMVYNMNKNMLTLLVLCFVGLLVLGCISPAPEQLNQTAVNQTQVTNETGPVAETPLANLSALNESDFVVVDDSISSLMIGQASSQVPE